MTDWTPDELATLPQTETVFDQPQIEFNHHQWVQEGYFVRDVCTPSTIVCHQGGIPIPSGKVLVKSNGQYDLKDELSR